MSPCGAVARGTALQHAARRATRGGEAAAHIAHGRHRRAGGMGDCHRSGAPTARRRSRR